METFQTHVFEFYGHFHNISEILVKQINNCFLAKGPREICVYASCMKAVLLHNFRIQSMEHVSLAGLSSTS